jgi:PAS domain S-box-containing protein
MLEDRALGILRDVRALESFDALLSAGHHLAAGIRPPEDSAVDSGSSGEGSGGASTIVIQELPDFDPIDPINQSFPKDLDRSNETETIDLSALAEHLSTSGSFNVRGIGATALGKLLQALPVRSLLINEHGTIVFANQAWEETIADQLNLVHRRFHELFPDPFISERVHSIVQNVFLTRRSQVANAVLQIDKRLISARVHFKSLRMGDERKILVLVEDFTVENQQLLLNQKHQDDLKKEIAVRKSAEEALIESEERMRVLIEASPIGIGVVQKGLFVYANNSFRELFACRNGDGVLGQPMKDLIDADSLQSLSSPLVTASSEEMPSVSFEGKGVKRSGERFDITLWQRGIHYLGETAGMIFVADTSEAKALRSQLLQAQKMEAVGTLAGGIAHDFNNILAVIQTTSELILLSDGKDAVSHVQRMLTACRRGAAMVQRLLAFSRKVEPRLCLLDLNHEVVQFRGLLESMISKMISIDLRLEENLPAISGDVTQIEQVLMNLASNSRDAMPDGGTLTIETRNVTGGGEGIGKDGSYVMLSVRDTGKGIEKEFMNHIFEPFVTTKETGKGTGLGLSTVYGIVEQHNGHIRCDSELGKSTTFRLYFPAMDWQEETREKIEIEPEIRGGNETILLVDDEDLIRELAKEFLTEMGYTVLTADDGKRALEVYQQNAARVDLVILDLVMPHMGGRPCLDKLLRMNPGLKILISSGSAISGKGKELIDAGAIGVVKKPYSLTEMLTGIRIALDAKPNKTTTHSERQSPMPEKKKIDAMEALLDLRDGVTHAQLMGKHGLTRRGLMSLLIKLQEVREAHGISDIDLARLRPVDGGCGTRTPFRRPGNIPGSQGAAISCQGQIE